MALQDFFAWIEATSAASAIAESTWMFPAIEFVHVLAIVQVIGSIAMLDLRLVGVHRRELGVVTLAEEVLPWTWAAFTIALISGSLMFISAATRYSMNWPFRLKMLLLVAAAINMLIFHVSIYRRVHEWNTQLPPPRQARLAGFTSLAFWISVTFAGRWIGFVR